MAINIFYPGSVACLIADINKQRFNEAVAAGRYPCAPEVRKGGTRPFAKDDIVTLFAYARLIDQEIPSRVAGEIACALREDLKRSPEATNISIPLHSEHSTVSPETNVRSTDDNGGGQEAYVTMKFDVAGIRAVIDAALKAANSTSSLSARRK